MNLPISIKTSVSINFILKMQSAQWFFTLNISVSTNARTAADTKSMIIISFFLPLFSWKFSDFNISWIAHAAFHLILDLARKYSLDQLSHETSFYQERLIVNYLLIELSWNACIYLLSLYFSHQKLVLIYVCPIILYQTFDSDSAYVIDIIPSICLRPSL